MESVYSVNHSLSVLRIGVFLQWPSLGWWTLTGGWMWRPLQTVWPGWHNPPALCKWR